MPSTTAAQEGRSLERVQGGCPKACAFTFDMSCGGAISREVAWDVARALPAEEWMESMATSGETLLCRRSSKDSPRSKRQGARMLLISVWLS